MTIKMRVRFKNRRFLSLIPTFLADETAVFIIKNRRFLREKARNEVCFCFCWFSKMWFYAMWTWQIIAFDFLFRKKSQR